MKKKLNGFLILCKFHFLKILTYNDEELSFTSTHFIGNKL